jgi:SAM-dependent methyltransferase
MLWRVAEKIEPALKIAYQKILQPPAPNIRGDRDVEYSWLGVNMPDGPGEALDFGCGPGWGGFLAARKGFNVTAIDLGEVSWFYVHPRLKFVRGDIFKLKFAPQQFDLVINCSTVEHVGLKGRYGVVEQRPDGDIEAMVILSNVLRRDGIMLLTIPVGADRVFYPLHRVYGRNRLPKLLEKYEVLNKEFWVKDGLNKWVEVDESSALAKEPVAHCYGLGLFVLRPSGK